MMAPGAMSAAQGIRITTAGKRIILERRENEPESCNSNSATEANATVAIEEKNQ